MRYNRLLTKIASLVVLLFSVTLFGMKRSGKMKFNEIFAGKDNHPDLELSNGVDSDNKKTFVIPPLDLRKASNILARHKPSIPDKKESGDEETLSQSEIKLVVGASK